MYYTINKLSLFNFMTEQQEHLANLVKQAQDLSLELEGLQTKATTKRELFLKVQGAIEYLTQIGVTLPQPEPQPEEIPLPEAE
jgi:hypothetical protein